MKKQFFIFIIGMTACACTLLGNESHKNDFTDFTLSKEFIKDLSNEEEWKRVYLATYPRSGNHWMRFLIEEATGIATSSVYRDPDPKHDEIIYSWEGYSIDGGYIHTARFPTKEDIVIIKTHFPALNETARDKKPYLKTLRILRHPIDAFYSFYCYKYSSIKTLPTNWVEMCCETWAHFQKYWDNQDNVITIRYEDLMKKTSENLSKCFTRVGLPIDNVDYAIKHHPPEGYPLKHIKHYTEAQLAYIEKKLSPYMEKMGYTISSIEDSWEGEEL